MIFRIRVGEIAFALLIVMLILSAFQKDKDKRVEAFEAEISTAKAVTSNPCSVNPIRLVQPPPGLDRPAVLVIGGEEIKNDSVKDLFLQPWEPAPGELAVRIGIFGKNMEIREIIWSAPDTKACNAGMGGAIKKYHIDPSENPYNRPPWPSPPRAER